MISDQERSEVAENLRNLTICRYIRYKEQFFDELAEVVVGFDDYHDLNDVLEKLADLIDRPKTRNLSEKPEFVCELCGAVWPYDLGFTHCPECGAEVVDDD